MGHKIKNRNHPRHGTQCVVEYIINRNIQVNALTVFEPHLYTLLPKYLRASKVKSKRFKFELNKFLEIIPNEPKMANYVTAARSNSILDQLSHRRAQ